MVTDVLMAVSVFVAVGLMTGTLLSTVFRQHAPERKRLRALVRPAHAAAASGGGIGLTAGPNALAERVCRLVPRSASRMSEMRQRLVSAGYRSPAAPAVYAASQIVCAVAFGVIVMLATWRVPFGLLAMVGGFGVPSVWLSHKVRQRKALVRNGLADVLDLLIVCLESGLGLDQAMLRCAEELSFAYKPIADELALVSNEVRAGTPRPEALMRFADRTQVDDVRALVTMLIQTDRYGTSIAQALRVHADLLRTRRRQRGEERAAKANVKLVFPLVLCLFPAFYILTLGPAFLQFIHLFMNVVADTK
jgi:tight adherence protein C